jgi:hypothetical protein
MLIVLPDESDRLLGWKAVEHSDARERGTGPASPASTGDLHALLLGAEPRFAQCLCGVTAVARQPEVRPRHPP